MPFTVPEDELRFRASRAGGPGGQHVNKTSTKVEVLWDVAQSPSLSENQRRLLLEKLTNRIDTEGILHVTAGERRSQMQNRDAAVERLRELVNAALHVPRRRKRTAPPASAREARLAEKKKRAEVKRMRKPIEPDE